MISTPATNVVSEIIAFEIGLACIFAILFLAFSLYFSLGPAHKFKEQKKKKSVTWYMAIGMCISLSIVLAGGNFLMFHFPWAWFLPITIIGSMLVSGALKIGYYKTPKMEIRSSSPPSEYPFTSPEETELAIKKWKTS